MTDTKQLLIVHVLFKEGERTIEGVVPGGIKTSNEGSLILMTALDENGQMITGHIFAAGTWDEVEVETDASQ